MIRLAQGAELWPQSHRLLADVGQCWADFFAMRQNAARPDLRPLSEHLCNSPKMAFPHHPFAQVQ